jgi:hydroxylamine reductase
MGMFCYQCEQTTKGTGCTVTGVCGKDPITAALQDVLLYATKGVSMYAHRAARLGARDRDVDVFTIEALFSTVTNVNFNPESIKMLIERASDARDAARALYEGACAKSGKKPEVLNGPAALKPARDLEGLVRQGIEISILERRKKVGDDLAGLQELVTYGLKGASAYADHAQILGKEDPALYASFHEVLDALTKESPTADELLGWALKAGEINFKTMELLDAANTDA